MDNGSQLAGLDDGIGPIVRDKRFAVFLRGVIGRTGSRNRMPLTVRNISAHGLKGECAYPPVPGEPVEIELPGLGVMFGQVRWGDAQTIGIEFDGPIDPTLALTRNRPGIRRSGLLTAH